MTITASVNEMGLRILIEGRFDFSVHKEFRQTYLREDLGTSPITIDLSRVSGLDSMALGMLLRLRELAGGDRSDITLQGFNESIGKILEISRFNQLFKLQST